MTKLVLRMKGTEKEVEMGTKDSNVLQNSTNDAECRRRLSATGCT